MSPTPFFKCHDTVELMLAISDFKNIKPIKSHIKMLPYLHLHPDTGADKQHYGRAIKSSSSHSLLPF